MAELPKKKTSASREETETAVSRHPGRRDLAAAFQLRVTSGPDAGRVFTVDAAAAGPLLIGTSEACTIRLTDPGISRRHASVDLQESLLRVRDLGSRNGTFVNRVRVLEALLDGGEEIALGSSSLQVQLDAEPKPLPLADDTSFGQVLGGSLAMRRIYPICHRLAESDVPLVLEGETGTGKEVLAEAIHAASSRAGGPFVVFDCTAVPGTLIDEALFGHERGAFTGAVGARPGVFEEASGGTLLIDEIGDLDKALQAKLLRAIQKGEIRRLGGDRWIQVNVRVLAATRRDLDKEVQEGRFRDDLFFRLAVARIALPPLRDRHGDLERLARHFWAISGGDPAKFPESDLPRLESHAWPGNVRELANTMARYVALGDIAASHGAFMLDSGADAAQEPTSEDFLAEVVGQNLELAEARELVVREFERRYVARLLRVNEGDYRRAAASSGVGERYLRMIRARVASGVRARPRKEP